MSAAPAARESTATSVAWTSFGAAIAQGLSALLLPALTRLYSPAEFGVFTVAQSVAGLCGPFAGLRYELAVVLARSERMAAILLLLQWTLVVAVTAVVAAVIFVLWLAEPLLFGPLGAWAWSIPAFVALTGIQQSLIYYLIRQSGFKQLAVMRVSQAGLSSGLPMLGSLRSLGSAGLIAGFLLGTGLSLLMPFRQLAKHLRGSIWPNFRPEALRRAASAHFRFPLYSVPYGVVGTLRERGLLLLFAGLATAQTAGLVAIAMRLSFFPAAFFASAIGPVIYREAASSTSNPEPLRRLLRRTMVLLGAILTPGVVLLWLYGESIFAAVLGQSWRDSGAFASALAFPALTLVLSGLFDRLFDVIKRQRLGFLIELIYSISSLSVVGIAFWQHAEALTALRLFAAATVIYHVAWIVLAYREWRLPMKDLLAVAGVVGATAAVTLLGAAGFTRLLQG